MKPIDFVNRYQEINKCPYGIKVQTMYRISYQGAIFANACQLMDTQMFKDFAEEGEFCTWDDFCVCPLNQRGGPC